MMKRTLIIALAFILIASSAFAQTRNLSFVTDGFREVVVPNTKVIVNFKRAFPGVENEKWSTEKNYYFATFQKDNIRNQVVYRHNGQLDYALKTYDEKSLPQSVRSIVKSVYYDYKITQAQELFVNEATIFVVKLKASDKFKTVRVANGQMEEIENYSTVISPCR